jgi:pimeloyl-ACP methyl ester carboxylesterase
LLLHAGIADSRMWHPQEAALRAAGFDVLAPDLRGFGQRPMGNEPFAHARDVEALLDGPAVVVGASLGGRVALELAVLHPDLVQRLVLIAPGLPGWAWSDETRAGWAAEEEAFEQGDFEAAAEASLRQWIDGPRRAPDAVDPKLRSDVREMILRSYELQSGEEPDEEDVLEPAINERLGDVRCPTLVIVGDEDIADMQGIAAHVTGSIGDARLASVTGASHLPSLECPDEVNATLLPFLVPA